MSRPINALEVIGRNQKSRTLAVPLSDGKTCYLSFTSLCPKPLARGRNTLVDRPSSWPEVMEALSRIAQTRPPA